MTLDIFIIVFLWILIIITVVVTLIIILSPRRLANSMAKVSASFYLSDGRLFRGSVCDVTECVPDSDGWW